MRFNLFNQGSGKRIKPSTNIYRKQVIEGFAIPAIIHNMHYFFTDLDIYEDGRVECWHFEDFDHFVKDVKRGWVATHIPDGEIFFIHGLGNWTIAGGDWLFNKETFIAYVQSLIKELNPKWENIYKYSEKKVNGITIGENGKGTIHKKQERMPNDLFPDIIKADSTNLFFKVNGSLHLVKVNVFADGIIQLSRLEIPIEMNIAEFERLINEMIILTEIPSGSGVHIYGLGKFSVQNPGGFVSVYDKLSEVRDMLKQLNGEPTTIQLCITAHKNYLDNSTPENKEALKIAYEAIPAHLRLYVGDMDTKDFEVRMIIYGQQD